MNLEELRRWEDFGGTWTVLRRTADDALLSLRRCDGGEEVEQIRVQDPAVLAYLARMRSADNQEGWGERTATLYEQTSSAMYAPDVLQRTVDFLASRTDGRPALEFAVGTGRVALPLSERATVSGMDTSEAMLAELATKPGQERLQVSRGDMSRDVVPGEFGLVYLVYNTITNLMSQDEQVDCFVNAARHLVHGGRFVIECFVPDLQRLPPGQTAMPFELTQEHLGFDTFDLLSQHLVSHHYFFQDGRTETFESPHRFVWPSELDLMARIAGLSLVERYADWDCSAFTADSRSHVSVWQKPRART